MANVGLDIGSTATKCVLWDGARFVYYLTPTGWAPAESAEKAVRMVCRRAHILKRGDVHITVTGSPSQATEETSSRPTAASPR